MSQQPKSQSLPHLWWCPTGPLAFLPIHAAGIYNEFGLPVQHQCVSDYVISSYTPTLSALLSPLPPQNDKSYMLAVIESSTLPATRHELLKIRKCVPHEYLVALGTPESPVSASRVLEYLPNASVAHFACHGIQDITKPLNSSLILPGGNLKISEIMAKDLPNASLAFLSACETAKGHQDLPDEVVHIAASMLFAGFHSVVATMWFVISLDHDAFLTDNFIGRSLMMMHQMLPIPSMVISLIMVLQSSLTQRNLQRHYILQ